MAFSYEGDVLKNIPTDHIQVGDHLDFKATATDLSDLQLSTLKAPLIVISAVPSLNTGVCQTQSEHLDEAIQKFKDVKLLTISCDLPFASNRICNSAPGAQHLVLSDYRYGEFGRHTKLMFPDVKFLCRALLILDHNYRVLYLDIANPVITEVNYQAAEKFIQHYLSTMTDEQ